MVPRRARGLPRHHRVSEMCAPESSRRAPYAYFSLHQLSTLTGLDRSRIGRLDRSGRGRASIILAVVDIAVDPAVVVPIGPDRASDSADRGADHRAFEDAEARDQCTGNAAESGTAERASGDAAKSRVIALRRTGIILAVLNVAVDISVIVAIRPDRVGKAADRRADRGALDHADARNNPADNRAAGAAVSRAFRDITGHPVVGGACAERDRTRQSKGQN